MDDLEPKKKFPHHVAGYVGTGLGVAALIVALGGTPMGTHGKSAAGSRHDWPGLGEDETIALGEALKGTPPGQVTIYCAAPECHALELDLDDAFQIAGWKSDFEDRQVDSEQDEGLFVGPPGVEAEALAGNLKKATGLEAKVVGITDNKGANIAGVGLIIGKVSK